jgi:flavin reductase (DIM6/NTAB) family NADH-FMN oxidoreductase RutF
MSEINPKELRSAFGTFMTGVTVVTTHSSDVENKESESGNIGFTANSFTSVSLDPPLLSVCLAKSMSCCSVFENCSHFAINILAEAQEDISNLFASYKGDRFTKVDWTADDNGSPLIDGVTTSFSCSNYQQIDAGDHMILIGKIDQFSSTGNEGLGYSNQGYFSLGLERGAVEPPKSMRAFKVGVIIESEGGVLLQKSDVGMQFPSIEVENRTGALGAISKYIESKGLDVEFGPVYSIFDNQQTGDYSVYFLANSANQQKTSLGEYYDIESVADLTLPTQYMKDMLDRYSLETKAGVFGLYLGDENDGDVHTI